MFKQLFINDHMFLLIILDLSGRLVDVKFQKKSH